MKLLNHIVALFLIFQGNSLLFPIAVASVCIPTNSTEEFFSTSSSRLVISPLFDNRYSNRCEVMTHCDFDLHFLMVSDTEYIFMYLLATCLSYFKKCLFRSSAYFLIGFYSMSYVSSWYILDIDSLSYRWFSYIFSHSIGCLFILLMVSFVVQKLFSLM